MDDITAMIECTLAVFNEGFFSFQYETRLNICFFHCEYLAAIQFIRSNLYTLCGRTMLPHFPGAATGL